jgi:hypothetical protein
MSNNTNKNRSWKPWEPWEEEFVCRWYGKMPTKKIAAHLGRTANAVRQKVHTIHFGYRDKMYSLKNAGVSYKFVLPEESWPTVEHFLASFCRYAVAAESVGKKLDVRKFMDEYMKAYARKDVELV